MQRSTNTVISFFKNLFGKSAALIEELTREKELRVLVVGDYLDGKKIQLLKRYLTQEIDEFDNASHFDDSTKNITLATARLNLSLNDSTGTEDYERLRPLLYQPGDIIILAFSLNYPASIISLSKWIKEARHYSKDCTILLANLTSAKVENEEQLNRDILSVCKEHQVGKPIVCNLDDLKSINRTFICAIVDKLASMADTQYLIKNRKAVNLVINPEKEAFINIVKLLVAGNKKNPGCELKILPRDLLILLIQQTAKALDLPYNKTVVDGFLKVHYGHDVAPKIKR